MREKIKKQDRGGICHKILVGFIESPDCLSYLRKISEDHLMGLPYTERGLTQNKLPKAIGIPGSCSSAFFFSLPKEHFGKLG